MDSLLTQGRERGARTKASSYIVTVISAYCHHGCHCDSPVQNALPQKQSNRDKCDLSGPGIKEG